MLHSSHADKSSLNQGTRAPTQTQVRPVSTRRGLPPVLRKPGCACGGGCASCQGAHMAGPDHPAEREADAVAQRVVSMAEPAAQSVQRMEDPGLVQMMGEGEEEMLQMMGKEEEETLQMMSEEEEEEALQMKSGSARSVPSASAGQSATQGLGAGRPLPAQARGFFESRMGADFSGVRIHDGPDAASRAKSIGAQAYTFGNNIVFNKGRFDTSSTKGRELIAHELTHVIQQGQAGPMVQRDADEDAERRMLIETTIRVLEGSPTFFGHPTITVDRAMFDRVMNGWLSAIVNQDAMAASDPDLQTRLRAAYKTAIASLIQEYATDSGENVDQLWAENSGRIPLWAWREEHQAVSGTSTPIAASQTVDATTGNATGTINGVAVTILPDAQDPDLTDHAVTRAGLNYSTSYTQNSSGSRRWGVTVTWTMSIQTFYPAAFGAGAQSGYGRGTTTEDNAGGAHLPRSTTLGHHEGEHGLAYQRFIAANPLPTFANPGTAQNKLTVAQFNSEFTAFKAAVCDYTRRMNEYSFQQVDCPGTAIGHSHSVPATTDCAAYTLSCS